MVWVWRGRGGRWTGPWPGRGPFCYLPPWQRPGWLWGYPYNPWVCARFPWLPRWWRAYPQCRYWPLYAGFAWPYMAYSWGLYDYPHWFPAPFTPYW